ncbi:MAG: type 2 isopentenyl-diphosphate Delta-isomerase [Candidatus Methanofastidiosia archaeon]
MQVSTKKRKSEHLRICLSRDVSFREKGTGFDEVELIYDTLPELEKSEIVLECKFLSKRFKAPLMVSAMSGGTERAEELNRDVATACQSLGIGMGLGSQRVMMENSKSREGFMIRKHAPDIFIAGNLGVSQLKEYSTSEIEEMLSSVGVDALAIHSNAAQEAVQPEGTTDFRDCLREIERVSQELEKPCYLKEVGHGISLEVAKRLSLTKIRAIDVQGAGGTSWVAVETLRTSFWAGETFWDFGIPTVCSILECRKAFKGKLIASGGVRNGLDVVKALVLGADLASIALPVLIAQDTGGSLKVEDYLRRIIEEIRIGMFLIGAREISELKNKNYLLFGRTREWVEQRLD